MIGYFDTSALLKLFITEPDSGRMRSAAGALDAPAVSLVAYAEALSAFTRREHDGSLEPQQASAAREAFEEWWRDATHVPVLETLATAAGIIAARYRLKGFDAIHLASAITLRDATSEEVAFLTADHRLESAAASEGFASI